MGLFDKLKKRKNKDKPNKDEPNDYDEYEDIYDHYDTSHQVKMFVSKFVHKTY